MKTIIHIYSSSFWFAKFFGTVPEELQLPSDDGSYKETNRTWRSRVKSLVVNTIIFYLFLHFLFILSRGVVSFERLWHGEVNGAMEASGWILSSINPCMSYCMFRLYKPTIENMLAGVSDMQKNLIKRKHDLIIVYKSFTSEFKKNCYLKACLQNPVENNEFKSD